ncbi:hypothetical protein SAMD00079811_76310 (plasmid) [Scytonema sp. HK-05]|uniref:eCIS core domain-containing protein n=1 Tax=Scytonema sp. HK-05 TaxID=1137095 RepID=UPI0009356658|nr:DUF4157 domain-containing protein [Scytonema sp. HK-05]OKH54451.1 hypothetical protein NIES2130_28300 [Scytonema sp. HK-05]BAY50002.1 hypothetical protein SAMD00079811_76310 [Scytonema sp. HK-05]
MAYQQVKKSVGHSLLQKKQSQMASRAIDDNDVQTNSQPPLATTFSIPSRAQRDAIRKSLFGIQGEQIQTKLTIGEPGDKYEQEADRVAAQVVHQINAPMSSQPEQSQSIQREAMPSEDELQMKAVTQLQRSQAGMTATPDLETSIQQAKGSGQSLADNIRQPMEQAFGADFSGVKVHTDAQSHQLNQSIQAKAFTTGQDVFFRQGEYNPGSRGGQELIAHELTHVVQQSGGAVQRESKKQARIIEPSEKAVLQRTEQNQTEEDKKGVVAMDKADRLVVRDPNEGELLIKNEIDKAIAVGTPIRYKIRIINAYVTKAELTQVGDRPEATDVGGERARKNQARTDRVRQNNFIIQGTLEIGGGARRHYYDNNAVAKKDADIEDLIARYQTQVRITDSDKQTEDKFSIPLEGNNSIAGAIEYNDRTKEAVKKRRVWHVGPSQGAY